ncbi:zinc ribbon domain-containing protein [Okeania sp.]|uniref:zinc ribbon domain-containing protein n=1 Tax=Okeania sp. TaxID=3100323 RepID=UPI0035C8DC1A
MNFDFLWLYLKNLDKVLERTHSCPHCDIAIDRDLNATINIKNRATRPKHP